jgi:hypothetical protein
MGGARTAATPGAATSRRRSAANAEGRPYVTGLLWRWSLETRCNAAGLHRLLIDAGIRDTAIPRKQASPSPTMILSGRMNVLAAQCVGSVLRSPLTTQTHSAIGWPSRLLGTEATNGSCWASHAREDRRATLRALVP